MRSSSAGLLLLVIGVVALTGFLTGNLDRWLAFAFSPERPDISTPTTKGIAKTGLPSVGAMSAGVTP